MKMIFLVDGDNNIGTGLQGIQLLTAQDTVLVFYGKGQSLASIQKLCANTQAQVQYLESVKGGKNSIDFQIITELGVLVGRGEADFAYVISQDKGYEAAIGALWSRYADTFREVALRPSIQSCLRASFLMRAGSREELAQALNREYGNVQGGLAYAHLEALFAPPQAEVKKPAARRRSRATKAGTKTTQPEATPVAPEVPAASEAAPAVAPAPAATPAPAEAPAAAPETPAGETRPRTHRGGRRRKKAAEVPAT